MEMKMLTELAGMLEDINPVEITSHILDGTLMSWLADWKIIFSTFGFSDRNRADADKRDNFLSELDTDVFGRLS